MKEDNQAEVKTESLRVRDLFVWKSFNKPQKQYSKEVVAVFAIIALLISIILAFFQEWLGILVTWAAYFLFWQLSQVRPEEVEHKITTEGIVSMGHSDIWQNLGPFWFSVKGNEVTLHIAHRNIFGQLIILAAKSDQDKICNILAEYLPYIETPEKSAIEKFSDWFSEKFPIEEKKPPVEANNPPEV